MSSQAAPGAGGEGPVFRWRDQRWPLLAAIAATLTARLAVATVAETGLNGDAAVHLLMGRHLFSGAGDPWPPLMFYGQEYVGALEGWLAGAVMLSGLAAPLAMGVTQALLASVLAVLVYRLCWPLGGWSGALAGAISVGVGSTLALQNAAGQYGSYTSTLIAGVGIWLLCLPMLRDPGARWRGRLVLVGLLVGVGYWNNPQIAGFLAPVAVWIGWRGVLLGAWREGQLAERLARWRRPLSALLSLALVGALICAAVAVALPWLPTTVVLHDGHEISGLRLPTDDGLVHLQLRAGSAVTLSHGGVARRGTSGGSSWLMHRALRRQVLHYRPAESDLSGDPLRLLIAAPPGPPDPAVSPGYARLTFQPDAVERVIPPGTLRLRGRTLLSLSKPERYMVRMVLLLLALLAAGEWLASHRGRRIDLVRRGALLALGAAIGLAPLLAFKLTKDPDVDRKKPPVGLNVGLLLPHAEQLPAHAAEALIGGAQPTRWFGANRGPLATTYGWARGALLIGLLLALLATLPALRRPPADPLPALLALHGAVVVGLYLAFPTLAVEPRYLMPLAIVAAGLIAWATGRLQRLHPQLGAAALVLVAAAYGLTAQTTLDYLQHAAAWEADPTTRRFHPRQFVAEARERGIRAGYANFWVGYPAMVLAGEEIPLATAPRQLLAYRPYVRAAQAEAREGQRLLWILRPEQSDDGPTTRELLRHGKPLNYHGKRDDHLPQARIRERWTVGRGYLLLDCDYAR